MLKYYVCWLLLMSAVTFFLMGWDKHLARSRRRRIPERVLLGWAAAGGALGGILAMQLFRHKTLHRHFSVGMPVMLAVQLLLGTSVAGHTLHRYLFPFLFGRQGAAQQRDHL